ncbi:DNA-directed RNA polymerase subunit RPB3/RPB11 [uncultured virus]|nr:DNA-directed RNA polymerase subunit RPB3/RPB11 [uncultured virus]
MSARGTVPNDQIDIYGEPDVSIKFLDPEVDAELRMELRGKAVDNSVINALRRVIMMYIPTYGFNRSNIFIETKKTYCMYNNSMIYNQIEMIPIYDVPNYFDLENPEIFLPTEVMKHMFSRFMPNKYDEPEDTPQSQTEPEDTDADKKMFKIEFSINFKNNTEKPIYISTHHAVLKIDGQVSDAFMNKPPICILVLKPTEELSMRAEANLGIAAIHAAYDATSSVVFETITSSDGKAITSTDAGDIPEPIEGYRMWFETLGQLDKHLIFTKACIILTKKLENLAEYLSHTYPDDLDSSMPVTLKLIGAEHTIGNLLATVLQKCAFTSKAGYCVPHPLIDEAVVSYQLNTKSKHGPIKVLLDCIAYLVRLFDTVAHRASTAKKK